jgi:cytochrome c2
MKKNIFIVKVIMVLMMNWTVVNAQTFTCTIQNQTVVSNQFKFDIYIQTTSGSFYIGNCDFVVTFSDANFTSPTLSRSINGVFLAGAVDGYVYSMSASIVSSNRIILNVGAPAWDNQSMFDAYVVQPSGTAPGTRVATITVTGITNPIGTANIQWRTTAPNNTGISNTGNTTPWNMTNITANGTFTNPDDTPLPVQLLTFTGITKGRKVELTWKTATEVNSSTFEIERRTAAAGWEKIGELPAAGSSNSPQEYSYVDDLKNVGSKSILYRLKTMSRDGSFQYTNELELRVIPTVYSLEHNYPNPFNPQTKIQYSLPEHAKVQLFIFDIIGRQVAELVNEEQNAGFYENTFNGSNLASGIYFYRIIAQAQGKNAFTQVKKMMLIK